MLFFCSYEVTGNHALRHMVTNDGYTSSMSYLGCHRDDDVTSPGEKNDEKNFDVVIHEGNMNFTFWC